MANAATDTETTQAGPSPRTGDSTASPGDKAPSFTKEQQAHIDVATTKAVSDALTKQGRTAADLEKTATANTAATARVEAAQAKLDAEQVAFEKNLYKDDPDKFEALQEKRTQETEKASLVRQKADLDAQKIEMDKTQETVGRSAAEQVAAGLSQQFNVTPATLLKFTDGTPEKMKELAESYGKKDGATGDRKPADSARSSAGGDQMAPSAKGKMQSGWDKLHPQ